MRDDRKQAAEATAPIDRPLRALPASGARGRDLPGLAG